MQYAEDMNYWQRCFENGEVYFAQGKIAEYAPSRTLYGAGGMSGNLLEMKRGRRRNFFILYRHGMISVPFLAVMVIFGEIKYIRLCLRVAFNIHFKRREVY